MKTIFNNFIQSNFDLEEKLKNVNIKLVGIFNKDNLPLNLKNGNYILNLDSSSGNGTHWTCFIKQNDNIIYFDSYGLPAPQESIKIMKPDKIYYNDKMIQHLNTSSCGYWCIAFLLFMYKVKSGEKDILNHYQEFLNKFDGENQVKNEKELEIFLLPF